MSDSLALSRNVTIGLEICQLTTAPLSLECYDRHCPVTLGSGSVKRPCSFVAVNSYLVDPASSHMLVSKIKPCMSKYKPH